MKQVMTMVCCACAFGLVGLSAAQSAQSAKKDKTQKTDKGMTSITVTGCVAENDGRYTLNSATAVGDTQSMSYKLKGGDLLGHVGHTVEVTGRQKSEKGKLRVQSVTMISATCS